MNGLPRESSDGDLQRRGAPRRDGSRASRCTDEEVERLTEELGAILDAVGVVAELDLADVPPTSHPLDLVNVWDEDEPRPSLTLDEVFANAPERDGDLFRVPPTV